MSFNIPVRKEGLLSQIEGDFPLDEAVLEGTWAVSTQIQFGLQTASPNRQRCELMYIFFTC